MKDKNARTIKELLDTAVALPDKVFAKYYDYEQKEEFYKMYSELRKDAYCFGNFFETMSSTQGEPMKVGFLGITSYEYIAASMGVMISGNVMITLDCLLSLTEVCERLNFVDATVFVYDKVFEKMIPGIQQNCPKIQKFIEINVKDQRGDSDFLKVINGTTPIINTEPKPDQLCAIMFTSGTTGTGKAVMFSQRNLTHNTVAANENLPEDATLFSVLPIHHAYCYTCDILLPICCHVTIAINDSMNHLAANMRRLEAVTISVVPMILKSMYQGLLLAEKKNPGIPKQLLKNAVFGDKLEGICSGGAYLDPQLKAGIQEFGIQVVQGYGITECSPRISTGGLGKELGDSCGNPIEGTQIKTIEGEIWVKSDSVMMGYYNNESATREVLTEDGWFKTGDLGYLDADNLLYITGRKKNLIILSNGVNISPEDIEILYEREAFVSEVMVYDEDDMICAEVYPDEQYVKEVGIANMQSHLEELGKKINSQLPPYKSVRCFKIRTAEFPKTTSRKIKRFI